MLNNCNSLLHLTITSVDRTLTFEQLTDTSHYDIMKVRQRALCAVMTSVHVYVVTVCVAKFTDPAAFMKLNLEAVTRYALFRLQLRLHKRPFATVDICSKLFNMYTKC